MGLAVRLSFSWFISIVLHHCIVYLARDIQGFHSAIEVCPKALALQQSYCFVVNFLMGWEGTLSMWELLYWDLLSIYLLVIFWVPSSCACLSFIPMCLCTLFPLPSCTTHFYFISNIRSASVSQWCVIFHALVQVVPKASFTPPAGNVLTVWKHTKYMQ